MSRKIKVHKPTSPGQRGMTSTDFSSLTEKKRSKKLTHNSHQSAGRNNQGKVTTRHRSSGGHKQSYRQVDLKRTGERAAEVLAIAYDPGRTNHLLYVKYDNGEKAYLLATEKVKVGQKISQGEKAPITDGNTLPLAQIPIGLYIHNVELRPGQGAKIARSAGTYAVLQGIDKGLAQIKLASGEVKQVDARCRATLGQGSNIHHNTQTIGKAGRTRHLGIRPTVRGKAMHPAAHPHGGGEGGNPIGLKGGPKTKWGAKALGVKTRKKRKTKLIKK